jgi:hypothetical protein
VVVDFKFQDYVVVSDFTIFREPTPARGALIMNRDNFNEGVNRIVKTLEIVNELQILINQELMK